VGSLAASPPLASEGGYPSLYRPRNVRATALYQLLESYYEQVKALYYGKTASKKSTLLARIRRFRGGSLPRLRHRRSGLRKTSMRSLWFGTIANPELQTKGICPSCDAKRAAAFAAFLQDELLENVGHTLFTFTLPKMLRAYFMHHRELLSDLARLAYETIQELMSEAVDDKDVRPGVVAVPQTFGSLINPHPHVHCLASRGVWDAQGRWLPVPYIDTAVAEKLFRHKTLLLLKRRDLLSDERIEL